MDFYSVVKTKSKTRVFKNLMTLDIAESFKDRPKKVLKWSEQFPEFYPYACCMVMHEIRHYEDNEEKEKVSEEELYAYVDREALRKRLHSVYGCKYNDYICDLGNYRAGKSARRTIFVELSLALEGVKRCENRLVDVLRKIQKDYYRHFFVWFSLELAFLRYVMYVLLRTVVYAEGSEALRVAIVLFLQPYYPFIGLDFIESLIYNHRHNLAPQEPVLDDYIYELEIVLGGSRAK